MISSWDSLCEEARSSSTCETTRGALARGRDARGCPKRARLDVAPPGDRAVFEHIRAAPPRRGRDPPSTTNRSMNAGARRPLGAAVRVALGARRLEPRVDDAVGLLVDPPPEAVEEIHRRRHRVRVRCDCGGSLKAFLWQPQLWAAAWRVIAASRARVPRGAHRCSRAASESVSRAGEVGCCRLWHTPFFLGEERGDLLRAGLSRFPETFLYLFFGLPSPVARLPARLFSSPARLRNEPWYI